MGIETALMVSAIAGAAGSIYSGNQQRSAYRQQATFEQQRANLQTSFALRDAAEERKAAGERAGKVRRMASIERGRARSKYAAANVVPGAGSAGAIEDYLLSAGESDAIAELTEGSRRARSITEQAALGQWYGQTQAGQYRAAGETAATSGYLQAGRSLLGAYVGYRRPGWYYGNRPQGQPDFSAGYY